MERCGRVGKVQRIKHACYTAPHEKGTAASDTRRGLREAGARELWAAGIDAASGRGIDAARARESGDPSIVPRGAYATARLFSRGSDRGDSGHGVRLRGLYVDA